MSLCERAWWSCRGPLLATDGDEPDEAGLYTVWPDIGTWARFYGEVRGLIHVGRERLRAQSVAEAMWTAWSSGGDWERARRAAIAARPDLRRRLYAS